jgi:hypothetical protein
MSEYDTDLDGVWESALQLMRDQGLDADAIVDAAARNLTHWLENPAPPLSQDAIDAMVEDEMSYGDS